MPSQLSRYCRYHQFISTPPTQYWNIHNTCHKSRSWKDIVYGTSGPGTIIAIMTSEHQLFYATYLANNTNGFISLTFYRGPTPDEVLAQMNRTKKGQNNAQNDNIP